MPRAPVKPLTFALVLAVLVVVASSALGVLALRAESRVREQALIRDITLTVDAERLLALSERRAHRAREFLFTGDPAALNIRDDALQEFVAMLERIEDAVDSEQSRQYVRQIRDAHEVVRQRIDELVRQRRAGVPVEVLLSRLDAEIRPVRAQLDRLLERFVEEKEAQLEAAFERAERTRTLALTALVGITPSALLVSGIVGLMLRRSIRKEASERRAAEARTRESEERMRGLLESTGEGIWGLDTDGRCIFANPACVRLLGYSSAEELVGRNMHETTHHHRADGSPYPREECHIYEAFRRGMMFEMDDEVIWRKDGTSFPVHYRSSPIFRDGKVIGAVVSFEDISARKVAENEILALNAALEGRVRERTAQLEETNRELESFTYSVSHDLRAPLRHIAGFAQLLERRASAALDEKSREYVRTISEAAHNGGQLVDELLAFSRMGRAEVQKRDMSLGDVVDEVRSELAPDAEGRSILWKVAPLPRVMADPILLRSVMKNLLSNALKYSRPRADAVVEVGARQEGGEMVVWVRDNGVGFDMRYANKLFGVFQRLHTPDQFEGTGIGLANVRRIVQRHGGRTWAEGRLEEGATFFFTLPIGSATSALQCSS
jgi:PAS domain S-box-containing protein